MKVTLMGKQGQLTLTKKRIIISRKSTNPLLSATMTHGIKGDKEIPIKNITAVQFVNVQKKMGIETSGYIQFSVLGGLENTGGMLSAAYDENTVMFSYSQGENFRKAKKYIDSIIDEEPIELSEINFSSDCYNRTDILQTDNPGLLIENNKIISRLKENITGTNNKDKTTAALLAFFLGGVGGHKFYLGKTVIGITYLLFSWTFIPLILSVIDLIKLISMDNDSFNKKYN